VRRGSKGDAGSGNRRQIEAEAESRNRLFRHAAESEAIDLDQVDSRETRWVANGRSRETMS
jgi:hypothetical protein